MQRHAVQMFGLYIIPSMPQRSSRQLLLCCSVWHKKGHGFDRRDCRKMTSESVNIPFLNDAECIKNIVFRMQSSYVEFKTFKFMIRRRFCRKSLAWHMLTHGWHTCRISHVHFVAGLVQPRESIAGCPPTVAGCQIEKAGVQVPAVSTLQWDCRAAPLVTWLVTRQVTRQWCMVPARWSKCCIWLNDTERMLSYVVQILSKLPLASMYK